MDGRIVRPKAEVFFITIIGGNKYCLEFGTDGNGNVSNWYLNNWPEGDIIDYYDSLEQ